MTNGIGALFLVMCAGVCVPQALVDQKMKNGDVTELDFSGLDQLTDDAFIVIKSKLQASSAAGYKGHLALRTVKCVGCVHITDYGVYTLAETFPSLEEVLPHCIITAIEFESASILPKCFNMRGLILNVDLIVALGQTPFGHNGLTS